MAKNTQIIQVHSMIIMGLGDIENKILAVGSCCSSSGSSQGNNIVELFDISSNTWTTKTSIPFCLSRWVSTFNLGFHIFSLYDYGLISRQSSVFGGKCDDNVSSLVAKYSIDKWERVGNLQDSRHNHRAIANGDQIYVVGGTGTLYVIELIKCLFWFIFQQHRNLVSRWRRRYSQYENSRTTIV